ncbi:MAG: adenylate kinase [Patescibacteria group bacterium]
MSLPDLILLDGPVGCGKGTQANLLATKFGYYQFGFGTELRRFVAKYSDDQNNSNYALASKIRQIMLDGRNVEPEDLFQAVGSKIEELIEAKQKVAIDSLKTMGAFKWLAEMSLKNDLNSLLIHFILDLETSLERLSHRYYVPSLPEIPFNSYEEALKHCGRKELPVRREDDMNQERILNQYNLYKANHDESIKILTQESNFKFIEIDARQSVENIFDKINQNLESYEQSGVLPDAYQFHRS